MKFTGWPGGGGGERGDPVIANDYILNQSMSSQWMSVDDHKT